MSLSNNQELDLLQRELELPPGAEPCPESFTTTYDDNLGSYGNMFDIQILESELAVSGFDFYTDVITDVTYEIYTKTGSFKDDNGKLDMDAWTLLKKGTTRGAGLGRGTAVRDFDEGDLILAANENRAFYVTLTSTDLRYRDIREELPSAVVGDTYMKNGDLEVKVGVSVAGYPLGKDVNFFGRRGWSGTLHYTAGRTCPPSAAPSEEESQAPTIPPSSFPSRLPTVSPTDFPTGEPSISPSWSPTVVDETRQPSVLASESPSTLPPSAAPTVTAFLSPTLDPTLSPTLEPSTAAPSESARPSPGDTDAPTPAPTSFPSTLSPSESPSDPFPSLSPSQIPTLMPSITPSIEESEVPSIRLSLSPSRAEEIWECADSQVVSTSFDGGTGAYGNMFTVTAKEKSLKITTISFHTDYTEGEVTAIVYTRMGDFVGFEGVPQAWRKISESSLRGGGAGFPSMIPMVNFESVSLAANETAAFYITLTTADIRYTRTNNTLGSPIATSEYLDINAGVGLADYPFASEFFLYVPRSFNGVVHFSVESECLPILSQQYTFNVRHPSNVFGSELFRLIGSRVESTARSLMKTQAVLANYAAEDKVSVDSAMAKKAPGSCTPFSPIYLCTPVDATLFLKHSESLRPGKLKFQWLNYYQQITLDVNLQFQAQYVGDIPVDSGMKISLNSAELIEAMSSNVTGAFEMALLEFLKPSLQKMNVTVLDVRVTDQAVLTPEETEGRYLQRADDDSVSRPAATIDVSTSIVGEYRPPPEIDFSGVVDDAIDGDPQGLEQSIKRTDKYFEIVESIEATPIVVDDSSREVAPPVDVEESNLALILTIALVCALTFFAVFVGGTLYVRRKKRKRGKFSTNPIVEDSMLLDKRGKKSLFGGFGRSGNSNKGMLMEADVAWAEVAPATTDDLLMLDKRPQSLYDSRGRSDHYTDDPNGESEHFQDEGGYRDEPSNPANHDSYNERNQNYFHESYNSNALQDSQGRQLDGGYQQQEGYEGGYHDHPDGPAHDDGGGYDAQDGYGESNDINANYDDEANDGHDDDHYDDNDANDHYDDDNDANGRYDDEEANDHYDDERTEVFEDETHQQSHESSLIDGGQSQDNSSMAGVGAGWAAG